MGTRKLVAHKCAQWAAKSREIIVLPEIDATIKSQEVLGLKVQTHRPPAKNQCAEFPSKAKCVSYDAERNTVCCCDQKCNRFGERCPEGVTFSDDKKKKGNKGATKKGNGKGK